jgi:hypothetical protein
LNGVQGVGGSNPLAPTNRHFKKDGFAAILFLLFKLEFFTGMPPPVASIAPLYTSAPGFRSIYCIHDVWGKANRIGKAGGVRFWSAGSGERKAGIGKGSRIEA